jgi:hypothetical protein
LKRLKDDGDIPREFVPPSPYPKWDNPITTEGDALIFTDIEAPFQHSEFINKCLDLADAWKIDTIHFAGDLLHYDSLSKWGSEWIQDREDGGMRQAGILAAAGIYALNHHVDRLSEDHANAQLLAQKLNELEEFEVDTTYLHTNMVFAKMLKGDVAALQQHLLQHDIKILASNPLRLVTHLDVSEKDIVEIVARIKGFLN